MSNAFHSISVQNILLIKENRGLQEALVHQRLRRLKNKTLTLEKPEGYNGGAVLYSPRSIEKACAKQRQQAEQEELQRLQKVETAQLRNQARVKKVKEAKVKRQERFEAKRLREEDSI